MAQLNSFNGGLAVDDRGSLRFCNSFNLSALGIKRFYQVENNMDLTIRAWHGHLKEDKYVYCPRGSAIVAGVPLSVDPDGKVDMSPQEPQRFVLSALKPMVLHIPAGYANGFRTLESDTILMFFSTSTVEESKGDDYRFALDHAETARRAFQIEIR